MITTITFKYKIPLAQTILPGRQEAMAQAVPLDITPYLEVFPLSMVSDGSTIVGSNIERTIVYTPIQPAFDALFSAPPDADQAKGLVRNLWTMVLAIKTCSLVTEEVTVA